MMHALLTKKTYMQHSTHNQRRMYIHRNENLYHVVVVKIGTIQKTFLLSHPPPQRFLGFFLMFYFSNINNSKAHFQLLVNQKGLHLEYVKYILFLLDEKSQKTYISLRIFPLLFELSYSVDAKNYLEKKNAAWSIKSLHCIFLVLINRLM